MGQAAGSREARRPRIHSPGMGTCPSAQGSHQERSHMTIANFSQELPDLTWVEVEANGEVNVQEGTLDATSLRNLLGGTPEQKRSPWLASVFVRTDPGAGAPVNWLATMLLRQSLTPGEQVRGPMVIL